jgi:glutamate-1-semialdehyde 2,1-aminomutase
LKPIVPTESKILRAYAEKTASSAERYRRARQLFPSGVTHDSRYLRPHPLFVSHAAGAYKWDVDGNKYVDYFGGHGSLILGHGHPAVMEAVGRQLSRGTHLGASHDLEMEWPA